MDTFFKTELEKLRRAELSTLTSRFVSLFTWKERRNWTKSTFCDIKWKKVTYCYNIASWWKQFDVKGWYWTLPTMLPESPGIEIGKLNRKPEFANTWTICKVGDSFVGNHRQQLYACITPIIEWFIFWVASCCLSTSEPAAQGFPASNTTWFIICLLCSITFGKVTFLLRNSHIFSVHPKGIINFPKMQCWSCQIMQKNAYMERKRTWVFVHKPTFCCWLSRSWPRVAGISSM